MNKAETYAAAAREATAREQEARAVLERAAAAWEEANVAYQKAKREAVEARKAGRWMAKEAIREGKAKRLSDRISQQREAVQASVARLDRKINMASTNRPDWAPPTNTRPTR